MFLWSWSVTSRDPLISISFGKTFKSCIFVLHGGTQAPERKNVKRMSVVPTRDPESVTCSTERKGRLMSKGERWTVAQAY